jgi:hypothetical protein
VQHYETRYIHYIFVNSLQKHERLWLNVSEEGKQFAEVEVTVATYDKHMDQMAEILKVS